MLSESEMLECLNEYKNGDMSAKNKLIEHNLRLVITISQKYYNKDLYPNIDFEDLVMTGVEGLIKGINTYDFDRGVKLITYVAKCINNQILMYLRRFKKDRNIVNLENIINIDNNGNKLKIKDICLKYNFDYLEEYIKSDESRIINEIMSELDDRDREILKMHFGFGEGKIYTQREIAYKFQISQSYVSRKLKKLSRDLKINLLDKDIYY